MAFIKSFQLVCDESCCGSLEPLLWVNFVGGKVGSNGNVITSATAWSIGSGSSGGRKRRGSKIG